MIVRDEEPRIEQCLRSIAPFVDEMVVVDTGSKDRTPEIAAACGARVFTMPWPDSFAAARNESLAHARGQWIFWMDADDVIAPESGRLLRELLRRHPRCDAAFQAQVVIPPGPGEYSQSVVDHVKLFPNRPDLRFEHRIHEQILPALRQAKIEVLGSEITVTHRNYDRSAAGQARKRARDFRLLELDLKDRPEHPFTLFNLGMTCLYATREYEAAAHYLRRSLDRSDWRDSIVRKAYAMLATARVCQEEWGAAIAALEEGLRHYPEDAELLFQAGQVYQQLGRFDEGRTALERLISGSEPAHYRSVDVGLRAYRGRHELALLYRRMGDLRHCEEELVRIATGQPDYFPVHVDLAETFRMLGKHEDDRNLRDTFPESVLTLAESIQAEGDRRASPAGQPDWGSAPQFGRRRSLLYALRLLAQLHPGPVTIVETGTLRSASPQGCWGDGWSTVAFGWYASQVGGRAYTVDIDPANLAVCRRVTGRFAGSLEYVAADSVEFLSRWSREGRGEIHLLYPDSVDHMPHAGHNAGSEEHSLREVQGALASLAAPALVLIDDTEPAGRGDAAGRPEFLGKGAKSVPFLLDQGFRIEQCEQRQVLLIGVP